MFQFKLHQRKGEIWTKKFVYEKGGVIKHIKASAKVKIDFPNFEKI